MSLREKFSLLNLRSAKKAAQQLASPIQNVQLENHTPQRERRRDKWKFWNIFQKGKEKEKEKEKYSIAKQHIQNQSNDVVTVGDAERHSSHSRVSCETSELLDILMREDPKSWTEIMKEDPKFLSDAIKNDPHLLATARHDEELRERDNTDVQETLEEENISDVQDESPPRVILLNLVAVLKNAAVRPRIMTDHEDIWCEAMKLIEAKKLSGAYLVYGKDLQQGIFQSFLNKDKIQNPTNFVWSGPRIVPGRRASIKVGGTNQVARRHIISANVALYNEQQRQKKVIKERNLRFVGFLQSRYLLIDSDEGKCHSIKPKRTLTT